MNWNDTAKKVLAKCKATNAGFVKDLSTGDMQLMVVAWAEAFAVANVPERFLLEGVTRFYLRSNQIAHPTPGAIVEEGRTAMRRWRDDPRNAAQIEAHDKQVLEDRDRKIEDGTYAKERGIAQIRPLTGQEQAQRVDVVSIIKSYRQDAQKRREREKQEKLDADQKQLEEEQRLAEAILARQHAKEGNQ